MTMPTFDSLRATWPRSGGTEKLGMRSLVKRLTGEDPLVVPDYQRPEVWTDDQCAKFLTNDQRMITENAGPTITIQYVLYETRAEVIDMYIRLNSGGTPHTDAEINRVKALRAAAK